MGVQTQQMRNLVLAAAVSFIAGCGHKQERVAPPPPPPSLNTPPTPAATPVSPAPGADATVAPPPSDSSADEQFVAAHAPIYSEVGTASWYGPPYHNRRGANGQVFDQNAITAAHRMLPMNSLIRVTNLQTGQFAVMRVTDRGPFVPNRTIDLSMASAKLVGVWRPGTAEVRIDVYAAPKSIAEGGRWCVQVGAFNHEDKALKLQEHLERMYSTANVIEFTGPTGHWVRIRPANDDKGKAMEIARTLSPDEGAAYLVRLD
jgi:rare lipoprotein A